MEREREREEGEQLHGNNKQNLKQVTSTPKHKEKKLADDGNKKQEQKRADKEQKKRGE